MVHSVYSNKDIFLRELISNAADACERLRHAAVTEPALIAGDPDFGDPPRGGQGRQAADGRGQRQRNEPR